MSSKLPSKAKFWGVREPELHVLWVITHWFNGKPVIIRDEKRRIATHHDPPLEDLFRRTNLDYDSHQNAHERLLNNGLLQEEYVCRRKIDWGPTQQGLKAIRECLEPYDENFRPQWADETDDGPIFGDPNEGVTHRKGVEIAGRMIPQIAVAWSMRYRGPYGVEWYPTDRRGESTHDLHIETVDWINNIGVEVITDNNNLNHFVEKWERFQEDDRLTFWVFDRRETACRMWNELDSSDRFYLDGGQFRNHSNWSAEAINRKIWRSSKKHREEPAGDIIQTVTGLLEGDRDTIEELFDYYYSN